jgi:NTE family protein
MKRDSDMRDSDATETTIPPANMERGGNDGAAFRAKQQAKGRTGTKPQRQAKPATEVKTVNLALQGGGSHGAFAWGVLDRLLEDERISFEGISATSAGAMNAVTLAYGLAEGGREGAKRALANFWRRISHASAMSPLQPTLMDRLTQNHSLENSPLYFAFDLISRLFSPYQFNPLNLNPLRDILEETIDFERLRKKCPVQLFLCATNVRSGKVKIFTNKEITVDAVLASGCLPFLFQAVEVDGEHYWDGGYMGNPAMFPIIYHCKSPDVVIVHINPIMREDVPTTANDILNRINEISFNSSLLREMRAIAFVTKLIDDMNVKHGSLRRMLIHSIEAEVEMRSFGVSSKLNADWAFLMQLHELGRERASQWLAKNYSRINSESTVDLKEKFL